MSSARLFIAPLIIGAILFGIHYYVWARLVRDTGVPPPWSQVAAWTLGALGTLVLLGFMTLALRRVPRNIISPVTWASYTWLGVVFFLLVLLAVGDLGRLVLGVVRHVTAHPPADLERRRLLSRIIGIAVGVAAIGISFFGVRSALSQVAVKTVRLVLPRWSPRASGYTIVQLTDIHVGPTIGREFIETIVAQTNALSPDLVVITGDLVDGSVAQLGSLVAPLANLRAKDGVYFVLGNHEYYSGPSEWLPFLETLGIRPLVNQHVRIGGEHGFDLAGVDDPTGNPDVARALSGRDPTRAVVLLAHQPKTVLDAAKHGVDLQLSGHTHGGQMFPFHALVGLQQPYLAGLHDHEGTKIYVSRGTGYWGPPMRVGAPAEITRIELSPA